MKTYTDQQILNRIKALPDYQRTANIPLLVGVQSVEDQFDVFDDKFFLYSPTDQFVMGSSGTTNAGSTGLINFINYGLKGAAVWEVNHFYPKLYEIGYHKGKMLALKQTKPIWFFRDNDKDEKAEPIGAKYYELIGANFHGIDYLPNSTKVIQKIGAWSLACQVCNNMEKYRKIIEYIKPYKQIDYCLLKEF